MYVYIYNDNIKDYIIILNDMYIITLYSTLKVHKLFCICRKNKFNSNNVKFHFAKMINT